MTEAELSEFKAALAEIATEIKHHVGVLLEHLGAKIDVIAEGQTLLRHELAEFRAEVATEFKEVRAQIRLSYSELDQRLHNLEHEVVDLRGRIERIEARFLTS